MNDKYTYYFSKRSNESKVEKYIETVCLVRLSLRSGLNLFHHFIQVGETVYSNYKESYFILGLNRATAIEMDRLRNHYSCIYC